MPQTESTTDPVLESYLLISDFCSKILISYVAMTFRPRNGFKFVIFNYKKLQFLLLCF